MSWVLSDCQSSSSSPWLRYCLW